MSFVSWLFATGYAATIRDSSWIYPMLQVIHIWGISMLAGSVLMMDLRLLGVGRNLPVTLTARHFLPWAWTGFALIVFAGINMLIGFIDVFFVSVVMRIKLVLILLAGLNAAWFHLRVFKGVADWDKHTDTPRGAKIAAAISILLWISVISMGKLLAYIGGKD